MMKNNRIRYFFIGLVLVLCCGANSYAQDNNCLLCHQSFEDEESGPSYKIVRDIHHEEGILCHDCHGGDPTLDDMDEVRESGDYRGNPGHTEVPQFCARCHSDPAYMHEHDPSLPTDQLLKYKTSVHGQRLFNRNDTKVANCISCHSVHEIGDAKMPHSSTHPLNIAATCGNCHADPDYMAEYEIGTSQVADYLASVHGKALMENNDLGAPACNDCHGNHGAAPPGVASLAAVCGNCHAFQAELFRKSPHNEAFQEYDYPMCETCHSNHLVVEPTDEMVGAGKDAVCTQCHSADDGTTAIANAKGIHSSLTQLVSVKNQAEELLRKAIEKGMMTTDEEFRLREVEQALIKSRTLVHSFEDDVVQERAQEGIEKAQTVMANSEELIDEYYFRRKGLGLATLFITILAIGLYIKIRRMN